MGSHSLLQGNLPDPGIELESLMSPALQADSLPKRLPAMWEPWVRSLGRGDPLETEMATYSSILACTRARVIVQAHLLTLPTPSHVFLPNCRLALQGGTGDFP